MTTDTKPKTTKPTTTYRNLYCIERVETEYYFGRWHGSTSEILPYVCVGVPGVRKYFKTALGKDAKIVSSTVAEYPLYEKECGIKIKTEFIAKKIREVYR